MKHLNLEEWVDFIHRVAPASTTAEMEKHLRGCPRCRQKVEWWKQFTGRPAAGDSALTAVNADVRGDPFRETEGHPFRGAPAELVWDSLNEPTLAGLRSANAQPRQLLFRAGDYMIDLVLGLSPKPHHCTLVGQVLSSTQPTKDVSKIAVVSEWGSKSIATVTNSYGEFQIDCEVGVEVVVYVQLPRDEVAINLGMLEPCSGWNRP